MRKQSQQVGHPLGGWGQRLGERGRASPCSCSAGGQEGAEGRQGCGVTLGVRQAVESEGGPRVPHAAGVMSHGCSP